MRLDLTIVCINPNATALAKSSQVFFTLVWIANALLETGTVPISLITFFVTLCLPYLAMHLEHDGKLI